MLVMLLLFTYKKVFKKSHSIDFVEVFKKFVFKFKYVLPFLLLSNTNSNNTALEVEKISFSIINRDSSIGFIDIEKTSFNHTTTYIVNSEVKAKVIFNFNAIGREKTIYKEDTLIYSSVYRKLNNKVKLNQSLSFKGGKYIFDNSQKRETLDFEIINRNLVTLFFYEPIGIHEVFSDKYKQKVKITSMGNGMYKLILPNRDINIYSYKNGKCTLIEVEGSFFKVTLKPNS